MSEFFEDPPSAKNPYRVFVRYAPPARGFGGTAFRRSYCLEYDDDIRALCARDLAALLAHEMVHNWPMMGKMVDSEDEWQVKWYNEGMSSAGARCQWRF